MIYLKNPDHSLPYILSLMALAWSGPSRVRGSNLRPSALKNLLSNYTHCRRRAWRKHYIESIAMITPREMFRKK